MRSDPFIPPGEVPETSPSRTILAGASLQLRDEVAPAHGRPSLDPVPAGELVELGPGQVQPTRRRLVGPEAQQVVVAPALVRATEQPDLLAGDCGLERREHPVGEVRVPGHLCGQPVAQ